MKKAHHNLLERCKRRLRKRLAPKPGPSRSRPVLTPVNIVFDLAQRTRAITCGGIGVIHTLTAQLRLAQAIDEHLTLLKAHLPYFESDHVLTLAYNVLTGGTCLQDIERLRTDEGVLDALGAERLPDPTTAGDFLRRFDEPAVLALQEAINAVRRRVWSAQGRAFHDEAILELDGTIAETLGECKQGMDMSYKGVWGYAPLLLTLASTKEILYTVNRSGNHGASFEAAEWITRALALLRPQFRRVWMRGDCDFALTEHFDAWDQQRVRFVFGYKGYAPLVTRAERLAARAWTRLTRPAPYEVATRARQRPENVKQQIVKARQYKRIRLVREDVAEFDYQPVLCTRPYRVVVVRKLLNIERGEKLLEQQIRYLFYVTNDGSKSSQQVVAFANARCNQENLIAQLKSGINALRMPTRELVANWAYVVSAALAWNLKAWMGLLTPSGAARRDILRMEFKRFLVSYIQIPCQILRSGRRIIYRLLGYRPQLHALLNGFDAIKQFSGG